jgi:hypothetical protein
MPRLLSAVALAVTVATSSGCLDMSDALSYRDQAASIRDDLARQEAAWQARLADEPAASPDRPQIEAIAGWARAKHAAADAAVRQVDSVLAEANNPRDPVSQAVGAIAPWLPEPIRTPLALGTALAVTVLRARRLKVGMASIAQGLQRAMREDEQFAMRFRQHAQTFRTSQTPLARRIVDETTSDRFMMRLPI